MLPHDASGPLKRRAPFYRPFHNVHRSLMHFPLAGDTNEEARMWPERQERRAGCRPSVRRHRHLRTLPGSLVDGGTRPHKSVNIKELRWGLKVGEANGPHSSQASVCTRSVTGTIRSHI